jgi:hypothetical protein
VIYQLEEPYEGRLSRMVLWEDWGEIPLSEPINCNCQNFCTNKIPVLKMNIKLLIHELSYDIFDYKILT